MSSFRRSLPCQDIWLRSYKNHKWKDPVISLLETLLGLDTKDTNSAEAALRTSFSFLFFSDVHRDIPDREKYAFMRDVTLFADKNGFAAIYIPERHFNEFGSIYSNSAVIAAYLIPQTTNIRFRTAGISLPLHHPAEIVEWWAMNDVLSGGRVDLGFGSGWHKADFIYAPENYEGRRDICSKGIEVVRKLWRGEELAFPGPGNEEIPIRTYPRPLQKELNVWLLVAQNEQGFIHAGRMNYNVFTMLYGNDLDSMENKISLYRKARAEAGHDPDKGIISLMLHTMVHRDMATVEKLVEKPFKKYLESSADAHIRAGLGKGLVEDIEREKLIDYAYHRYFRTGALFGSVEDCKVVIDKARRIGVDDIVFLVDFGVPYAEVSSSLPYLAELVSHYSTDQREN